MTTPDEIADTLLSRRAPPSSAEDGRATAAGADLAETAETDRDAVDPDAATSDVPEGAETQQDALASDGPEGAEEQAVPGDEEAAGGPVACPYLAAAGGGWRSLDPVRDHRCTALDPPAVVSLDKQRRLCLVAAHGRCPTYLAAREARGEALASVPDGWEPERRFVRTTPVVVEVAPRRSTLPASLGRQRLVEATVAVLALVVVVLVGSRVLGGSGAPPPGSSSAPSTVVATPSPAAASPSAEASTGPQGSSAASFGAASPSASDASSAAPAGSPAVSPSGAQRTYTVKAGDTLSGIGIKLGVSWQQIAKANKIKSPYRIVKGQVLVIPTPAP